MNIIIDLDLQQAVQGFGSRQAALPYQVKSQDTPTVALYFVRGNVTYDLGASPGLRFGVFLAGNPNPLVQQNTFTRTTDNLARTVYVAYPNFNTVQMQAAIGSQPQLSVIGELRYQTTFGTIARTADIAFTVVRTLLNETVMDNLIAAFVTPAVNANVTARISNTGWLSAGLNISIAAGAGAYQVVSVTNVTDFVAKNLGGASNAASGTTIPSGTAVGIAPVNVLQAYPDPSIIEVTTHKDVINGYAGLDGTGLLKGAEMPVDGTTIAVSGGKLTVVGGGGGAAGQNAYTTTSASFVVPAVGATVSVAVHATTWMGGTGYVVFITGAGYYAVSSITDATHAVLTNVGGTSNAIAGTSVPSGATVAAAGPAGAAGAAGTPGAALSAYDALASSFVMPAPAANVTITIANTAWLANGQVIYIASAGYFQVASISNATQALVTNLLYSGNASAGATIASGSKVSPGGLQGPQGTGGAGLNAYTTLSANYTQPAVNTNVTVNVGSTSWMAAGQGIFIQGGGYYTISSIADLTHAVVTNLGGGANPAAGSTITGSGTQTVAPAGIPGVGGQPSYTVTTASFTQPAVSSSVTVTLASTAWMAQNQYIFINGGGTYQAVNINDATHAVLQNVAATGNVVSGTVVPSGSSVSPSGPVGPQGATGPSGGISDAPSDGNTYGRKNAAWITVSAGGTPGDPFASLFFYDDFISALNITPGQSWQTNTGASAVAIVKTAYGQDSTRKFFGSIELACGTGTSGTNGAGICIGQSNNNPTLAGDFFPGIAAMTFKYRLAVNGATAPVTGNSYTLRAGLMGFTGNYSLTVALTQRAFFEYSPDQNSGQWRVGVGTSSTTYSNTSATFAVDTAYDLQLDVNAANTQYTFTINGTVVATITAGLPTGAMYSVLQHTRDVGIGNNYRLEVDAVSGLVQATR